MAYTYIYMEVSWNKGTPKSSMLMVFSIINHPFSGTLEAPQNRRIPCMASRALVLAGQASGMFLLRVRTVPGLLPDVGGQPRRKWEREVPYIGIDAPHPALVRRPLCFLEHAKLIWICNCENQVVQDKEADRHHNDEELYTWIDPANICSSQARDLYAHHVVQGIPNPRRIAGIGRQP